MRSFRSLRGLSWVIFWGVLLGVGLPADTLAARQRSSEPRAARSTDRAKSTPTARSRGAEPRTRASGTATYGYARPRHHPNGGWYGGWYGGGYWGYPFAYGAWWYYGAPYGGVYVVTADRAERLPVYVETDLRPKRATVVLDGEVIGQARDFNASWQALELTPGVYEFEFRYEGYRTLRLALDLKPGRYYRIEERLVQGEGLDPRSRDVPPDDEPADLAAAAEAAPAPSSVLAQGLLRLRVQPSDAAIYLDGEYLGLASELERLHGALPVAVGSHRLDVVRPGYAAVRRTIDVPADEPLQVDVALARDGG